MSLLDLTPEKFQHDFQTIIRPRIEAWFEFQAVPSYVERYKRIANMSDRQLAERLEQLNQECPDLDDLLPRPDPIEGMAMQDLEDVFLN
jgi:hypothetical protein